MNESWEGIFSPYLSRIAWAVGRRIIPAGGEIPYTLEQTRGIPFLEKYVQDLPGASAMGIKALLVIFDLCPILFIFKPHRFVNLSPEDQDLYILDWHESRIYWRRMVVLLLKTLFGMGYYNDPKVLEHLGWYDPCLEDKKE